MSEAKRSRPPRARLFVAAMLTLSLGLLAAAESTAQVLYGSVIGSVKDSSGAAIPGATVTITNKETSLTRDASTGDDGGFSIINVLPGTYDLKVSLQGFREYVKTGVRRLRRQPGRVEVSLEVGQLSETVTVASPVELLQTDKADTHTELKAKELVSMPLPVYRNYQSLINLVPGATPAIEQNALTDTPGRSLRTFVNGANPNNNATKSDGATNVNLWLPHHVMYVAPAETIDTVNVSTSNFDAETGMAGGAAITVITKSGTNDLRGSAFEFFNNEKLNARPYFATAKTPVDRNIFGGTVGGPIAKNKLFFFGSYEGFFDRNTAQQFYSVPTAAMRNGDFSGAVNTNGTPQIVYDPSTGNTDGTGRTPFAGNVVPAGRISPIAQRIQNLYPLPNTGAAGALTNNYVRNNDTTVDRHNFDAKINWNRTSVAPDLGQVLDDGRDRVEPVLPGRGRRRRRRHEGLSGHRRPHLDALADDDPRQHVRLLAPGSGGHRSGLRARQLRHRRPRHPRHQRPGSAPGGHSAVRLQQLQRAGQQRRLEPADPRRAHLRVRPEPDQGPQQSRVPHGLQRQLPVDGALAARSGQSARSVHVAQLHRV